jgi:hypothetical protein
VLLQELKDVGVLNHVSIMAGDAGKDTDLLEERVESQE